MTNTNQHSLSSKTIRDLVGDKLTAIGFDEPYMLATSEMVRNESIHLDDMDSRIIALTGGTSKESHDTTRLRLSSSSKQSDALILKSGVSVLMGRAGSGKSLLATRLELFNPGIVERINYGEPEHGALCTQKAFIEAIIDTTSPVIIGDSIRAFFFSGKGATGKGGVNMSLFMTLTMWDILARSVNKHIMFILNPLSSDDATMDLYVEAAAGAVSMVMHATSPGKIRVTGRYMRDRSFADLTYSLDNVKAAQDSPEMQTISALKQIVGENLADLYIGKGK